MKPLLPGTVVRVRPWPEIAATLDVGGALDGLPFMEEMRAACGRTFSVWRRADKLCAEADGMRRMTGTVMLDGPRCSGAGHGGCEKRCRLLWREAWLEPAGGPDAGNAPAGPEPGAFPFPGRRADGRYVCQATELLRATVPLAKADPRQYLRDVVHRTWTPRELLRFLAVALRLRLRVLLCGLASVRLRSARTRTPSDALGLQPGEWVAVKTRDEIAATLDRRGCNRGLEFPPYMLPFLGRKFQVERRVTRVIAEKTGELRELQHTVALAGVTCDGYGRWGGCPRDAFHLWREIWLRRMPPPAPEAPREVG